MRDGAARGRRPLLRAPVDEGVRRRLGAGAARDRAHSACTRSRARCSGRGRTSTPRSSRSAASRPAASAPVKRIVEARVRPSAQDARELARARRARVARACRRGARRDRPRRRTCAPRSSSRPSSSRSRRRSRDRPRAREDQPRARRRAARATTASTSSSTVYQRVDLGDRVTRRAGGRDDRRRFPGGHDRPRTRSTRSAAPHGWRVRIEKHIPVAAGLGGGSSDAATALRLANAQLEQPLTAQALHELAARVGADVPFFLATGRSSGPATARRSSRSSCRRTSSCCSLLPKGATKPSTAAGVRRLRRARGRGRLRRAGRRAARALAAVRRPRDLAALPANDLARSPLADELRAQGAFRADVSGAGPAVYGLFHRTRRRAPRSARARRARRASGSRFQRGTVDTRCSGRTRSSMASSRPGRWLRERRFRLTLWIAAVEGLLYLVGRPPLVGRRRARRDRGRSSGGTPAARAARTCSGRRRGSSRPRSCSCSACRSRSRSSKRVAIGIVIACSRSSALILLFTEPLPRRLSPSADGA